MSLNFQDCKRGKNERIITASEFFPKSLNDIYVSLDSDVSNGDDEVNSINDKEIQRADFVRTMSKETLQALAYLDYKGVVHTNLVKIGFPYLTLDYYSFLISYCRHAKPKWLCGPHCEFSRDKILLSGHRFSLS